MILSSDYLLPFVLLTALLCMGMYLLAHLVLDFFCALRDSIAIFSVQFLLENLLQNLLWTTPTVADRACSFWPLLPAHLVFQFDHTTVSASICQSVFRSHHAAFCVILHLYPVSRLGTLPCMFSCSILIHRHHLLYC